VQTWLGSYAAFTPGVECFPNTTVILGPANTPQPDACLCIRPGERGPVAFNEKRYLVGAPELVAEIAASSVSLDLGDKKEAYAMAGVREYLVWRTENHAFDWFVLESGDYVAVKPDRHGHIHSGVFPGLVLDVKALLAFNGAKGARHSQPRPRFTCAQEVRRPAALKKAAFVDEPEGRATLSSARRGEI